MQTTVRLDHGDLLLQLANQHTLPFSLIADNLVSKKVTLTNAEIKALETTQKELVAAPGATKMLQFVGGVARLIAGTEVLAEDAGGSDLQIKYTDDSGVGVSEVILATGFLDQATNAQSSIVPLKDAIVADEAGALNQALVLDNVGGAIVGNSSADATMEIYLTYRVLETA